MTQPADGATSPRHEVPRFAEPRGATEASGAGAAPDQHFADPRLAEVYDALDPDRSDLDLYRSLADGFGADTVLDVGCGTGSLALLLADGGRTVVGVDPAEASVAVARTKPGAERVRWVEGEVAALTDAEIPPGGFDLATMTGNVAQVFVTDQAWDETLTALARVVRRGGCLVFETRRPDDRAWERWTPEATRTQATAGGGSVRSEIQVTSVDLPLVSFETTFRFERSTGPGEAPPEVLVSTSTLRFRTLPEIEASLTRAGFDLTEALDAPDRPGREWVIVARRN